jgi:hypothetical protein
VDQQKGRPMPGGGDAKLLDLTHGGGALAFHDRIEGTQRGRDTCITFSGSPPLSKRSSTLR